MRSEREEASAMTRRQRLLAQLEHLAHVLPGQAPLQDFVHHNTLHGFQHLPFAEAVQAAEQLNGARPYWPEARFRALYAQGRINDEDLLAAFEEVDWAALDAPICLAYTRRQVWRASLLAWPEALSPAVLDWRQRESREKPSAGFFLARLLAAQAPASSLAGTWQARAAADHAELFARLGQPLTRRALLLGLSGEDVWSRVRRHWQAHLAAHLDLGIAAWRNPDRAAGLYAAWRASAGSDVAWELDELPLIHEEIQHLPESASDLLFAELACLGLSEEGELAYLERLALEMPGWSGMVLWRERHPDWGDGPPVALLDYLAIRLFLERLLCDDLGARILGRPAAVDELRDYFATHLAEFAVRRAWQSGGQDDAWRAAALARIEEGGTLAEWEALAAALEGPEDSALPETEASRLAVLWDCLAAGEVPPETLDAPAVERLLDCVRELSSAQRGHLWLLAYERHYREQLFAALQANRRQPLAAYAWQAQVVMCMDDREEGTRRHLEAVAPDIQTFGAAGFFGLPIFWRGLDDPQPSALCPVVVTPRHLIEESVVAEEQARLAAHVKRRGRRLRWRERLFQGGRLDPLNNLGLGNLIALPAVLGLAAASLAPAWLGAALRRWQVAHDGRLTTQLTVTAQVPSEGIQKGLTESEQVERVEAFLRSIGLVDCFAPLVLILGHGAASRNNPHQSAYACGACSGRHGGPNARVFAQIANRPALRAGLRERGIDIPATTWFVAAEHNTTDDAVHWYDLEQVPAAFAPALDALVAQVAEACRRHAVERCRRLASAPPRPTPWTALRHVQGRSSDFSQARPELGHATNAAALIGRRSLSRGLFLDRRCFLISYDPTRDADGGIIENILLAAGPVGAGISLEYYFSTVDNAAYGCGSKVTHNLTGLFGVMAGSDSDLLTGLPMQMVEIHEPMRLLVVVEQSPDCLAAILARQPALQALIGNAWIILAAADPGDGSLQRYCPRRGWLPWSGRAVAPQVVDSAEWFMGECGALPPAILRGARA